MNSLHGVAEHEHEQLSDLSRLEILSRLASTLSAGEEAPELVHDVRRLLRARSVMLHRYDQRINRLHSAPSDNTLGEERDCDIGIGIIGRAALYQEAICLPGGNRSPQPAGSQAEVPILALPILGPNAELLGVLSAEGFENMPFSEVEIALVASLAVQLGASFVHRTVAVDLSRKQRELEFLNTLLAEVGVARSAHEVIDVLTKHACDQLGAETAAVLTVIRDRPCLFTRIRSGRFLDQFERREPMDGGLLAWVHARGLPAIIDAPDEDARCKPDWLPLDSNASSLMAVPITAGRRVLGSLEVRRAGREAPAAFSNDDLRTLSLLADHASRVLMLIEEREQQEDVQRLAVLGRALSGVAHDIRSPLTVVSANTELLMSDPSDIPNRSKSILGAVDEISELVTGLMALAGGRSQVVRQQIELATLEPMFRERLANACRSRKIALTINAGSGAASLDLMRTKRIVHNLSRNAVEAMGHGGKLLIEIQSTPENVRIIVRDTGPGLPEVVQRNLFQPFVTHAKEGGCGLGLYIVHRCVRELGGQIHLEVAPGQGTTFTADLPTQPIREPS